jgi:DNA-binding LacI/PurR family transcriptional regulator
VVYLHRRGRSRIAYLASGSLKASQNSTRLEGYLRAIREQKATPICIATSEAMPQFEQGREAGQRIVTHDPIPDAVQAFSDEMALGFLYGLHESGVRVPMDLALVGFDNRSASQVSWPRLTTVAQPNEEVGVAAAEILLAKLAGKAKPRGGWSRRLPTRLVVRETA